MRLVIISGRSGSGKSTALHILEDVGYTCIDNLPASLLPNLITHINHQACEQGFAVSIDARNTLEDLEHLPEVINSELLQSIHCKILYLDADDTVLLQRFSETRRKHPLSSDTVDLKTALSKERTLLSPIVNMASLIIDTSSMSLHDLRDTVKRRIMGSEAPGIAILFESFGFKHGSPKGADLVFDVRCLPNPHWIKELRPFDGRDQPVADFLKEHDEVQQMEEDIANFLTRWLPHYEANNRSYLTLSIGCTGGQHRSVYLSEQLAKRFKADYANVQIRHRELNATAANHDSH